MSNDHDTPETISDDDLDHVQGAGSRLTKQKGVILSSEGREPSKGVNLSSEGVEPSKGVILSSEGAEPSKGVILSSESEDPTFRKR